MSEIIVKIQLRFILDIILYKFRHATMVKQTFMNFIKRRMKFNFGNFKEGRNPFKSFFKLTNFI